MDGLTDWRFRIYATLSLAWVIRVFVSSSWYSSFWRLASAREGYSDEAISQERLKCRECASSAATEPNLLQRKQRDNVTWLCANFGIKNEVLREMSTNPSPIRLRSVPGHNVFCSACAKNQETVVRLLSCYDPPNSVCQLHCTMRWQLL